MEKLSEEGKDLHAASNKNINNYNEQENIIYHDNQ